MATEYENRIVALGGGIDKLLHTPLNLVGKMFEVVRDQLQDDHDAMGDIMEGDMGIEYQGNGKWVDTSMRDMESLWDIIIELGRLRKRVDVLVNDPIYQRYLKHEEEATGVK